MKARALWTTAARTVELRSQELPKLGEDDVRVRTLFTAVSRGTESLVFRGRVPKTEWERMRAPMQEGDFPFPVKYGYICVGEVEEVGGPLDGRKVFCLHPHQERFVAPTSMVHLLPTTLEPERAVLAAGMETSINAIWDSEVSLGDRIVVVGAGVIGALCAYLAGRIPGCEVVLCDTNEERAEVASKLGVDFATPGDLGGGFDAAFHTSATGAGLSTALAALGDEARVTELSWYGDAAFAVNLGGNFHSGRLGICASQVGQLPAGRKARWDYARRMQLAFELLHDNELDALISGESSFDELPEVMETVLDNPQTLCHRIRYSRSSET